MQKHKVEIVTMEDVHKFVGIASKIVPPVKITNEDMSYIGNAKSILGIMASLEWGNLYIVSDSDETDLYMKFKDFIVD